MGNAMPVPPYRSRQGPQAGAPLSNSARANLPGSTGWKTLGLCAGLLALVFAAFFPALHNGFVNFDDPLYVTENSYVRQGLTWDGLKWALGSTAAFNWHPLTWLSYMTDYELYGLQPWGYHLTNVLLHALNTCLVFLVLSGLTGATWRSLVVAAVFGLHPLRVESVAWVAERKDVLSAFFFLLTIWAYARYAARLGASGPRTTDHGLQTKEHSLETRAQAASSRAAGTQPPLKIQNSKFKNSPIFDYALALVFCALGLMSKPMLVTLPFVLLLLDYWPLGRLTKPAGSSDPPPLSRCFTLWGRLVLEKLPFFALAAGSSVVTLLVQQQAGAVAQTLPVAARAENAVVAYCRYLGKIFWPVDLCVIYPHPDYWPMAAVAGSVAVLLAISLLAFLWRRRWPYFLTGWLWYLGMLVPVIGLVQVGQQSMADRYTYLPMLGILLAVAWGIRELATRRRLESFAWLGAAAVSLTCLALTQKQVAYWKDGEVLFRRAIAVTANNALAHGSLARALADQGRVDEAIEHYRRAAALDPHDTSACNGLGNLLAQKGDIDGATREFQEALRRRPGDSFAHNNLGLMLARKGMIDAAVAQFREAVKLKPDEAEPHHNLGLLLANQGAVDEAIQQYREAVRLKPDYAKAHKNLGMALARKGQLDEAITEFQIAVRLQPGYSEAQRYLQAAQEQKAGAADSGPQKR